jgi:hypothetical protein
MSKKLCEFGHNCHCQTLDKTDSKYFKVKNTLAYFTGHSIEQHLLDTNTGKQLS